MCPEYMEDRKVSVMTDVYSFGVVVLEIVSGRKCVSTNERHIINVVSYCVDEFKTVIASYFNKCMYGRYMIRLFMHIQANELWKECKALELMDESIQGDVSTPAEEQVLLRCIRVGLLCTQFIPCFRPTMPSVIKLLEGEISMELQDQ